jgi:hypothetical protein
MEFGTPPSWRIEISDSQVLDVALYIRGVAGLVDDDDEIPSTWPPIEPTIALEDRDRARRQWREWWTGAVNEGPSAILRCTRPHFPEFAHQRDLRALLVEHFDAAVAWSRQQSDSRGRPPKLSAIVRSVETSIGRPARPFSLRITRLPVAGDFMVLSSDNAMLVGNTMIANEGLFTNKLMAVVEALA